MQPQPSSHTPTALPGFYSHALCPHYAGEPHTAILPSIHGSLQLLLTAHLEEEEKRREMRGFPGEGSPPSSRSHLPSTACTDLLRAALLPSRAAARRLRWDGLSCGENRCGTAEQVEGSREGSVAARLRSPGCCMWSAQPSPAWRSSAMWQRLEPAGTG